MAENVNPGWRISAMSEAGLLYTCLRTGVPGVRARAVDESDREPLGWHQWRDWHTEEQLRYAGLRPTRRSGGIISILCLWRPPGHKTSPAAPHDLVRGC